MGRVGDLTILHPAHTPDRPHRGVRGGVRGEEMTYETPPSPKLETQRSDVRGLYWGRGWVGTESESEESPPPRPSSTAVSLWTPCPVDLRTQTQTYKRSLLPHPTPHETSLGVVATHRQRTGRSVTVKQGGYPIRRVTKADTSLMGTPPTTTGTGDTPSTVPPQTDDNPL